MCITKKSLLVKNMPLNYNLSDNILPVSSSDEEENEGEEEESDDSKSFKEFEKRHQMTKASMKKWGICKDDKKGHLFPNISLDDNAFDKIFQEWVALKKTKQE